MNYVFFGSPDFAAVILEKLISAGFVPAAVVCNPDRPVGRKKVLTAPPVKQLITNGKWQIEIFQPEALSSLISRLSSLKPDFFVVAAYSKIIPKEILAIPRLGTIGVHPSLLPKYRGATPIQSAILNGDAETGVTLYLTDEKVDHGPILENRKWKIGNSTYEQLHDALAKLAGELLVETLPKFLKGKIKPAEQNHAEATFTKKFTTEDAYVKPEDLEKAKKEGGEIAIQIDRKIRALNPEPGTWSVDKGKRIKLLEAEIIDGKLRIKKIQKEGGKAQSA